MHNPRSRALSGLKAMTAVCGSVEVVEHDVPGSRSSEVFHCRAVYGPPSARASKTGGAPWRARERDSTGWRSGATGEREVSEGSESPERKRRRRPGIEGEGM